LGEGVDTKYIARRPILKNSKVRFTLLFIFTSLVCGLLLIIFNKTSAKQSRKIPLGDYSHTIEFSEQKIQRLMKRNHLPSVAVALIDDQDTIWSDTFGLADLEGNTSASSDTVYKLWSIAKVFTAIETMRLVEDNLVDLDAPITEYLPDLSIQSRFPDSDPITIRSILTHRSGIPRNECHRIEYNLAALGAMVSSLEDCHQVFPVGSRYKYTNMGFDVLGYIIQEKRGELYPKYLRNSFLVPIGMNHSAFARSQLPHGLELASGYEYYKGEYYPLDQYDVTSFPSSNLSSTLEDMTQFVKFLFRDGEAIGEQIISPRILKSMYLEQSSNPNDPQQMGLGWKVAEVLGSEWLVWHDGGAGEGIGSIVAFLPERKLGVVLFANGTTFEGSVSLPVALDILEFMLETKYGVITQAEADNGTVKLDPKTMSQYTGKYIAFGQVMDVFLKGDHLKGRIQGITFSLKPVSDTTFQPNHWLVDLGLAEVLNVPIDLKQLRIEFKIGGDVTEDVMIANFGDIVYEIYPRYPQIEDVPDLWVELTGEYDLVFQLPSGTMGREVIGNTSIWFEDGVLQVAGFVGPILPISGTEIIILSGPFAGETMVYEPDTGFMHHQMIVYKPR
jgi:CubicO group peptidase (beta-lactamase class C family)